MARLHSGHAGLHTISQCSKRLILPKWSGEYVSSSIG
jgi:hypothetical protein